MTVEQQIEKQGILKVVHPNMSELAAHDQVMFSMLRKSGLGASDASIYLGVNLYETLEQLIEEKKTLEYTARDKEISEKENVRKGRDLEPLILQKFMEKFNVEVAKPSPMYQIAAHPQLTINFDGILSVYSGLIPVEAKFVSTFGAKFYDKSKCINNLASGSALICGGATLQEHITQEAELYGIPNYYYTQVQQQMLGTAAPFAYLAAMFDKGWDFQVFKIFADKVTQDAILRDSALVWKRIKPLS